MGILYANPLVIFIVRPVLSARASLVTGQYEGDYILGLRKLLNFIKSLFSIGKVPSQNLKPEPAEIASPWLFCMDYFVFYIFNTILKFNKKN